MSSSPLRDVPREDSSPVMTETSPSELPSPQIVALTVASSHREIATLSPQVTSSSELSSTSPSLQLVHSQTSSSSPSPSLQLVHSQTSSSSPLSSIFLFTNPPREKMPPTGVPESPPRVKRSHQSPVPLSSFAHSLPKLLNLTVTKAFRSSSTTTASFLSSVKTLTIFILLTILSLPSSVLADRESAFFRPTSFITIPNYTWRHTATMQIVFRTCFGKGDLFSLVEDSTSSTSSSSSPTSPESLSLSLVNGVVILSWSISGQSQQTAVPVGQTVNDDSWYRVRLKYQFAAVNLAVFSGSDTILGEVVVANSSYNNGLLDNDLTGPLTIGQGFYGCMFQGPGVNFNSPGLVANDVDWDKCPPAQGCFSGLYGCDIEPCQNQGTCQELQEDNQIGRRFRCICPEGYTGVVCETTIDLCNTQPCLNGICISGLNTYTCNCSDTGYNGFNCSDDINECSAATNPCGDVDCFNHPGGFTCDCPRGYDGSPCVQVNECVKRPCKNGGTCEDGLDSFTCQCPEGYTGPTCGTNIDECVPNACTFEHSRCKDLVNDFTCVCEEGFTGDPYTVGCGDINECDPPPSGRCRNQANCTNQVGTYICSCLPGFTGVDCETNIDDCDPDPCQFNATCRDGDDSYSCDCLPGYTGPTCGQNINECADHDCRNGANCTDLVNGYRCDCVPGWTGDRCERDIDECNPNPCFTGKCEDRINGFYCNCPVGYTGLTCNTNIDDCDPDPCQNNGTCLDGTAKYTCECHPDWMGHNCTEVYNACAFSPCKNGANCTSEPRVHEFQCTCPTGFTGSACEINIDDCALAGPNACESFEKCRDGVDSYTCGCPIGFGGDRCEKEIDECDAKPCQNNGNCTDGRGNYTCSCQQTVIDISSVIGPKGIFVSGYTGQNCEVDINECEVYQDPPICQSGGKCENTDGAFECFCRTSPIDSNTFYVGTLCESLRSYCDIRKPNQQCLNGATCINIQGGSECQCAPGFSDPLCSTDIDECLPKPCRNNGTCEDRINSYKCTCQAGWTGEQCETDIDDCVPNPCRNRGICEDGINSFSCNCTDTGFEGDICQLNIDDCVGNPCANGGTCEDRVKGYTCSCLPAYKGSNCVTDIPDCDPSPCLYGSTCKERSNVTLYGKGDPEFDTFTFANAAGYVCECAEGVKGVNCSEDIDECEDPTTNTCQNGATCENVFQGFTCACVPGYTGQMCEEEIDECQVWQPCKNGGNCTDLLNDYSCSCPAATVQGPNYAGKNCTIYLSGCDSPPRLCNLGDCIPHLITEDPLEHNYTCICPKGYRGRNCDITTDFSLVHGARVGYFRNDMTSSGGQVHLSLSFRTTLSEALIVLCELVETQYPDSFILVELHAGRVQVRYQFPPNPENIVVIKTDSEVNDGQYHHLDFSVSQGIQLTMPFSDCTGGSSSGSSPGVDGADGECRYSESFLSFQPRVSLLYIGSKTETRIRGEAIFPGDYIGCMRDVTLNGNWIYPGQETGDYYSVIPGCSRQEQCVSDVCSSRGGCVDLWDKFECRCDRPYTGEICGQEYPAATFLPTASPDGSVVSYRLPTAKQEEDVVELSFFLTTRQKDGFVAYFSSPSYEDDDSVSFMGLYLKDGTLAGDFFNCGNLFQFDTTESPIFTDGVKRLDDGQQHLVMIDLKPLQFHLLVDGRLLVDDSSTPFSSDRCQDSYGLLIDTLWIGQPPARLGRRRRRDLTGLRREKRQTAVVPTRADLALMYGNMNSFEGVIQDVQVNSVKLTFDEKSNQVVEANVVAGKNNTRSACTDLNPCVEAIECTDIYFNDYECTCRRGYRGKNCTEPDFCSYDTCPEESSCVNLRDGYECVGVATFLEKTSVISYSMSEDLALASSSSDLDLTFTMRTRGLYGLVFQMRQGQHHVTLRVARGHLEVNYKLKAGEFEFSKTVATKNKKKVNDGKWHFVNLQIINSTHFQLKVYAGMMGNPVTERAQPQEPLLDDTDMTEFSPRDQVDLAAMLQDSGNGSELLLGGPNVARGSKLWEAPFIGCLWGARIRGVLLPFYSDDTFSNNSNTERFLVVKKNEVGHDCSGENQCGAGGPGYRYCGNGGQCKDEWNDFSCQCRLGFEGSQCEINPNNCDGNQCLNHATCLDGENDYTCICMPGFTGNRCQTQINHCDANECQNGGECVDRDYGYTCNCSSAVGYTGWYCNVTLNQTCSSNPCQNGANCIDVDNSFECVDCPALYEGPLCERQKDVCASSRDLCQNGGTCHLDASTTQGYRCECDPTRDFEGPNCTDKIENCVNINCGNGQCKDGIRNYTCLCENGWNGADCSQAIDACGINAPICQHSSNCSNGVCVCDPGYTGERCDMEENECERDEPICKNEGVCTNKEAREGGFLCNCTVGYKGDTCSVPFCENQCEMGSTCETNDTSWSCVCPEFIEGKVCDKVGPCYFQPCEDGKSADCIQSIEDDTYMCKCNRGWQGQNCSDDVNECETNDASLRHNCVDGQSECRNNEGSFTCGCFPGYTGVTCGIDINECASSPCLNGGRCTDEVNNFTCDCSGTGFEGFTCATDVDECKLSSRVCSQGNCTNVVGGFTCQCGDRWRGPHCERENLCYNISCQNGGACQENVTLLEERCACASGYEGVLCEKASHSSRSTSTDLGVIIGPIVGGVVLIIIIIVVVAFLMTARSKRATRGAYSPSAQENAGSRVENGSVLKKPPEERLI